MAQQNLIIGPVDGDAGDTYFAASTKIEANFTDLYGITDDIVAPVNQVVVNVLADLPTPVAGEISLNQDTQYLVGDNLNIGTNSIDFADGSALMGIDSIVITITYTGTGDMFTGTDVQMRISNFTVLCTSGRFINWSDTLSKVLRVTDCTVLCDRLGVLNGGGSVVRFTNFSPVSITTTGFVLAGNFGIFRYESSIVGLLAGIMFDLGIATFTGVSITAVFATLAGGTTFLSGLAGSANINAGGVGTIFSSDFAGAGSALAGVTVQDALWQFLLNDDIADTRPDGLLSLQSNATNTVITTLGVYVLIAGTWTIEGTSQFTGTTAGRLTYIGGKDTTVPVDVSASVEPASGTNKDISIRYAINGVVDASSTIRVRADSGNPILISIPWQDTLSTNDFVEFFVTNDTDTTDILVSTAIMRVN